MHIVSQKQQEIQSLKMQLCELERLSEAEKQADEMAKQLIEVLKEENLSLNNRIMEVKKNKQQMSEIYNLKSQFDLLKKQNVELQQKRYSLNLQVLEVKNQFQRINQQASLGLSRTKWDQNSYADSQSRYSSNSYQVAPNLVESRYIATTQIQNNEELAQAIPEYAEKPRPTIRSYLRRII